MGRLLELGLFLIAVLAAYGQEGLPNNEVGGDTPAKSSHVGHPAKRATITIHQRDVTVWEVLQEIVDDGQVDYYVQHSPPEIIIRDRCVDLRSFVSVYYLLDEKLVSFLLDLCDHVEAGESDEQKDERMGVDQDALREKKLIKFLLSDDSMSFPRSSRLTFLPRWRLLLSVNSEANTRQLDRLLRTFSRTVQSRGNTSQAAGGLLFEPLSQIHQKLSIMLPVIELQGLRLPDAVGELGRLAKEADPQGTGIRLRIDPELRRNLD